MNLNKDAILNGTPRKILRRKFDSLKENLTKNGAFEYYLMYTEMKLGDILSNFDLIYKEPYKGSEFITKILRDSRVNPIWYQVIGDEVSNYLYEITHDINSTQYSRLLGLKNIANEKSTLYRKYSALLTILDYDDDYEYNESPVVMLYNERYKYDKATSKEDSTEAVTEMNNIILVSDIGMMVHILLCCSDIKELVSTVSEYIRRLFKDCNTEYGIVNAVKAHSILHRIYNDPIFQNLISNQNDNFKYLLAEYADNMKLINIINDITVEKKESVPCFSTIKNAINNIYDIDIMSELNEEEDNIKKAQILEKEKAALQTASDMYLFDIFSLSDEELDDAYDEAICELYSNNSTIHLESADSGTNYVIGVLEARIEEIDNELMILEYTNNGNATPVVKNELGEHNDNKEPVKPKQTINHKIQSKALDTNVKSKKIGQSVKHGMQEAKNTAKAVMKVPKNVTDAADRQIKEWDDMDDDKRKKYILEAGFRKKYFRLFKLSLTHYVAFAINPLLNVILFMCQKLSAEKNARIRNELASELEAEIRICEEKISDANSKGDNDKKYKLMRIKDKLTNELTRVKTNSRYV